MLENNTRQISPNIKQLINILCLLQADDKIFKHLYMLELKQSFVKAIDRQSPGVQQFEETMCQFSKHSASKTVKGKR